ncbi:MAG: hypothetical protein ABEH83_10810 [Halobacterium sp.]
MDRLAVAGGTVVTAATVTLAVLRAGTPEVVVLALIAAGALTGAASRSFQSEFLDAFAAGAFGFAAAVTVLAWGFGGADAATRFAGRTYNAGILVYLGALTFAPVPGLCAALGGGVGARVRRTVGDAAGRA